MTLATLIVEREPLRWADLPPLFANWVQDVGALALLALVIVFLARAGQRYARVAASASDPRRRSWYPKLFLVGLVGGLIAYGVGWVLNLQAPPLEVLPPSGRGIRPIIRPHPLHVAAFWCNFAGGVLALGAVAVPFVLDVPYWRWRRIWALAKLSFREAVRRKVLWVFASLTLLFLFYTWFQDSQPQYQVRSYVTTVYWVLTPLLLITASFVAAFGLPADIRQQTIHTIVTKPVERFEIVLGRFLGYTLLMTLVLVVMTGFSLLYLFRDIDPEAARESVHARVPLYADLLYFPNTRGQRGESVGDEFEYRGYIMGQTDQRAVWLFREVPADLARRESVPCEFSFSIFRTHKGDEGKGVLCTFEFKTWRHDPDLDPERQQSKEDPRVRAEKYGIYEVRSVAIVNFHTLSVSVPGELFKNALEKDPEREEKYRAKNERVPPPLRVEVRCDDRKQLIGAAKHDLYFLERDRSFAVNFFKGAAGLWLRLCLVVGLAVALSTYLNAIISWMATWCLYLGGVFLPFVHEVAAGVNWGGGPMQSLILLGKGMSPAAVPDTPTMRFGQGIDSVLRWILSRFIVKVFPDVSAFDLKDYVAQGFDISASQLLVDTVQMSVYLLPFALLAYYLLRAREVANPM
jgi:hypothetical protein